MSTDNVIAVGGLAEGSIVLIVAGVTFSMLLLFVASSVIARLVERVSWLLDLAAIVLGWTAAHLALNDPGFGQLIHLSEREKTALHFYLVALIIVIDLFIRAIKRRKERRASLATADSSIASGGAHGADDTVAVANDQGTPTATDASTADTLGANGARIADTLAAEIQQPLSGGPHGGTAGEW